MKYWIKGSDLLYIDLYIFTGSVGMKSEACFVFCILSFSFSIINLLAFLKKWRLILRLKTEIIVAYQRITLKEYVI